MIILLAFASVQSVELTEDLLFYYQTQKYDAKAIVFTKQQNIKIGISSDTDVIDFGQIYENMSSRKYINVTGNKYDYKVKVYVSGNISEFVNIEKNNFILEKNQATAIPILFSGNKPGNYNGEVKVVFKRVKYPIFNWLLKCV